MGPWIAFNKSYDTYIDNKKADELFIKNNPNFEKLFNLSKNLSTYHLWKKEYDALRGTNRAMYDIGLRRAIREATITDTFVGSGYNKTGVQIELENGKQYLIGDITTNGNNAGCCAETDIKPEIIVTRFRVVFDEDKEE